MTTCGHLKSIQNLMAVCPCHEQVRGPRHLDILHGSAWVKSDSRWVWGVGESPALLLASGFEVRVRVTCTKEYTLGSCTCLGFGAVCFKECLEMPAALPLEG